MNEEQQLKLQSFLDGELPEGEARDVAALVARDADAAALLSELRHTRQALADFEPDLKLPESREFYWSKIEREIHRREPAPPSDEPVTLFGRWRRLLLPVASVASLAIILLAAGLQSGLWRPAVEPDTEMTVADSSTFTYHDYANGTTLVWLSYP